MSGMTGYDERDARVARKLEGELGEVPRARADLATVVRRSRSLKVRRAAGALTSVAAAGLVVWAGAGVVAGDAVDAPGNDGGPRISQPAAAESETTLDSGWTRYRNDEHGYSVEYPQDWQRAPAEDLSATLQPTPILALGTYAMRPGDGCGPTQALLDLRPQDAMILVVESESGEAADYKARPTMVSPRDFTQPTMIECFVVPVRAFSFEDGGRLIDVFVALGDAVEPGRAEDVWQIVNSLELD